MRSACALPATENRVSPALYQKDAIFSRSSKRKKATATQHKNHGTKKAAEAPKLTFSQAIGGAARTTFYSAATVSSHAVPEAQHYGLRAALHGWRVGAGLTALRIAAPSVMMQGCLLYYQAGRIGDREAACTALNVCTPYRDCFQASLDARAMYSDNIYLASAVELVLGSLKWSGLAGLAGATYGTVRGLVSGIKSLTSHQS
jgi:hypothetical protein